MSIQEAPDTTHQITPELAEGNFSPPPEIHNHVHVGKDRRIGWKGRAVIGSGLAAVALIGYLAYPRGEEIATSIQKAKVTKVYPTDIDLRAIVEANIRATATDTFGHDFIDDMIDKVPVFSWLNEHANATEGMTSIFTGFSGGGAGEVVSLVGVKADEEQVITKPNGKIIFDIPSKAIEFITAINESNSSVITNNGVGNAVGEAFLKAIPFTGSLQQKERADQAKLNQDAREAAVNEMSDKCDDSAWSLAQTAITEADISIALTDHKNEAAAGEKLLPLTADDITVNIGTPKFSKPYHIGTSINGGKVSVGYNSTINCQVAPNALDTSASYINGHGNPLITGANG